MSTSTYRPVPRRPIVRRRPIGLHNANAERLIRFNKLRELSLAIEHGYIQLNSLNESGLSLLHLAVQEKKYPIVEALIELGIDRTLLSVRDNKAAMHIACMNGFISIVRLMVSKGLEDVNLIDAHGKSPLDYSIDFGHKPISKFLIGNGASYEHLPQTLVNEICETREERIMRLQLESRTRRLRQRQHEEYLMRQRQHEEYLMRDREMRELRNGYVQILPRPFTPIARVEETKTEVVRPNKDIIDLIINNEIVKKSVCPISMEEIEKETASITNCFHVFSKENIENWLKIKNFCPVCKAKCFVL
jgi:hypothetical protein